MRLLKWLAAAVVLFGGSASVASQEFNPESFGLSEVRGGVTMSGIETWGLAIQGQTLSIENIDSVQFDALFNLPDLDLLRWIGSPRVNFGGVINLRGRESLAHLGLTWHLPVGDVFYAEASIGVGVHNGALSGASAPLRNLGCRALVHWSWGIGANLTENLTLTANLQHLSNVYACSPNDGINHVGVSLGWKF